MNVLELVIRPGMSEAIEPRLLPIADGVATPRLLQNLRFRQLQRAEKRPGTLSLGTTGLPTAGSGLWSAEWNGLAAACVEDTLDNQIARTLYVRDASAQWNYCGRTGFVVPERRVGVAMDDSIVAGSGYRGLTCVAINGVVYVAWAESGGVVHLTAMDPGGVILRDVTLGTAASPRLIYANSVLYLVTVNGTSLEIRTVTLATLALSGATTIAAAVNGNGYDAAPMEGAATWLLAYPENATTIRVRVMSGTSSSANTTITTTSQGQFVSVCGTNGSKVMVAYVDGNDAEVSSFSDTLTGAANTLVRTAAGSEVWTCQSGIVRTGSNEWHVVFGGTDQSASPALQVWMLYHARLSGAPAVTEGPYRGFRFLPCSKPFVTGAAGSRRVSVVCHDAETAGLTFQSSHVILDLETQGALGGGQQLSAISYEHQPWFSAATEAHNPEVASLGASQYLCPLHWYEPAGTAGNTGLGGLDALVFRAATTSEGLTWTHRATQEVSGALCVSGGALYEACSAQFTGFHYACENGFANDPITQVGVAAGGALTSGRLYSYKVTYAWVDPLGGRIHRSAPSVPDTVTPSGGNLTATVRVAGIGCSGRFGTNSSKVIAEVYRSWNGGPYYFCGSTTAVLAGTLSVTYTDSASDATVEANRRLYTDGVLQNDPPSGARLLCVGGGRVWAVGWRERVPQFSKLMIPTAPVEFCDHDTFRVFGIDEPLTAIGYMDGVFVAWSERSIFIVTGDGPNDQGVGTFSEPRRIPCTVGADSPHVAEVAQGLMYKGAGTIWLLPRGFGPPQPVGDEIQETLAAFPYLRSAARCSNADDDCTHFVLAASDSQAADTRVAVWDNRLGTWSLDDIAGEVACAGSVDGKFTWLLPTWDAAADVPARQLSASSLEDLAANNATSTWIESRVAFGDWRLFGPTGLGVVASVALHGESLADSDINLTVEVDHAAPYTVTWQQTTEEPFYLEHKLRKRKSTVLRLALFDSEHAGSGKTLGAVFHTLRVLLAPLAGGRRIPPAKRAA